MAVDTLRGIQNCIRPVDDRSQKVCFQWQAGRCYRYPCPYLHPELPPKHTYNSNPNFQGSIRNSNLTTGPHHSSSSLKWERGRGRGSGGISAGTAPRKDKVCKYWLGGNCRYGDGCHYLHSWVGGDSITFVALLEGHQKAIRGIALPSGSEKLYSASIDESVRVWDCHTAQCSGIINLGGEIGCVVSEGSWIFVGVPNSIKVWNTETNADYSLEGPVGQVHALVVRGDLLFAGAQDGSILVWRFNVVGNRFEPVASLKDHQLAVVSLTVGNKRLYSGSMDNTIKVWDLETLQCIQSLTGHTSVVMSLLCCDQFLLSCSLDKTIKVWTTTDSGSMEVTYTHNVEVGVLCLFGMPDEQAKPVLLCACNDACVRLYDLPSFNGRGKLFTKEEVRTIGLGPGGLFFTGDGKGKIRVWKWSASEPTSG